jgi:hypothetical protein
MHRGSTRNDALNLHKHPSVLPRQRAFYDHPHFDHVPMSRQYPNEDVVSIEHNHACLNIQTIQVSKEGTKGKGTCYNNTAEKQPGIV